jgi:hypothetical protein
MVKIDYSKVDYWEIDGEQVILFDKKRHEIDRLQIHMLVSNWLSEMTQKSKSKIEKVI